jgi:hypothetical protein
VLANRLFFWFVWLGAVLQATWVAVVSRYPMAFDEAYHYNLVHLHAGQWSPLFLQQPAGPAPYGALVRDPSWLHHYILSFPYRLLESLGANEYTKVVGLRLCNVAFFAVGLYLFRKLLLKSKASTAAVHAALLFYILLPTVPQLAGQINYDNLQFPLVALALLFTHGAAASMRAKKLDGWSLALALFTALLGTLNKFTFLPFLATVVVYLGYIFYRHYGRGWSKARAQFKKSWQMHSQGSRRALLSGLVIVTGLFVWFYGVNTVVYHNPVIQCHQVLEPVRCQGFEPWLRNYTLAQEKIVSTHSPIKFTIDWIGGMFYRTMFVINGASGPKRYTNAVPMGIAVAAILLIVSGLVLTMRYGRRIIQGDVALQLCLLASLVYLAALWGRNYNDFLHLGAMVAINGRYLQPVLLPIILLVIASFQWAFRLMPEVKLTIFTLAIIGFLSGGGITGFIHYSDVDWFFEDKAWMSQLNTLAQKFVAPLFLFR